MASNWITDCCTVFEFAFSILLKNFNCLDNSNNIKLCSFLHWRNSSNSAKFVQIKFEFYVLFLIDYWIFVEINLKNPWTRGSLAITGHFGDFPSWECVVSPNFQVLFFTIERIFKIHTFNFVSFLISKHEILSKESISTLDFIEIVNSAEDSPSTSSFMKFRNHCIFSILRFLFNYHCLLSLFILGREKRFLGPLLLF